MKYMHAIGQHERLSLANGLLLVQMFSQADKLRTISRGMPGVKKKKGYSNFKIENRMPPHRTQRWVVTSYIYFVTFTWVNFFLEYI